MSVSAKEFSYLENVEFQPDLVIVLMVERALVEPIAILDAP